ncbi:hypothetical protein PIB30_052770 [Stylosanthes scabra]|uniref:Uncharacterized protein n=1 Tax=Stylosanthes scabra TaxID=79078 RepID=A0ABU6QIP7_9FABA|nr:hypothetical protein [Stylosanthes scabra]
MLGGPWRTPPPNAAIHRVETSYRRSLRGRTGSELATKIHFPRQEEVRIELLVFAGPTAFPIDK